MNLTKVITSRIDADLFDFLNEQSIVIGSKNISHFIRTVLENHAIHNGWEGGQMAKKVAKKAKAKTKKGK